MSIDQALCLFGSGGHGRVVASQLSRVTQRPIVFGDAEASGQIVLGISVLYHSIETIDDGEILITIGDNAIRRQLQNSAGERIAPAIIIGPEKVYSDKIGVGSQILAGAVVNQNGQIGSGVIVNSNAVVEHDCRIGDFCHIAPGAIIGGGATVGDGVLIGSGAVVLPGVFVASDAIVGAGAVVDRDIPQSGTWVGVPAKRMVNH